MSSARGGAWWWGGLGGGGWAVGGALGGQLRAGLMSNSAGLVVLQLLLNAACP